MAVLPSEVFFYQLRSQRKAALQSQDLENLWRMLFKSISLGSLSVHLFGSLCVFSDTPQVPAITMLAVLMGRRPLRAHYAP